MPGLDSPFAIGSETWPGTSKLTEEVGEQGEVLSLLLLQHQEARLLTILGKLIATGGEPIHFSGRDLHAEAMDETADVHAALLFFEQANFTPEERERMAERVGTKLALFHRWHDETRTA